MRESRARARVDDMTPRLLEAMPSATTRELRLEIRRGAPAFDLLGRPEFREAWHWLPGPVRGRPRFRRTVRRRLVPVVSHPVAPVVVAGWSGRDARRSSPARGEPRWLRSATSVRTTPNTRSGSAPITGSSGRARRCDTFRDRGCSYNFRAPGRGFAPPDRWLRCSAPVSAPISRRIPRCGPARCEVEQEQARSADRRGNSRSSASATAAFAALLDEIVPS
jgi:hypothetical protein